MTFSISPWTHLLTHLYVDHDQARAEIAQMGLPELQSYLFLAFHIVRYRCLDCEVRAQGRAGVEVRRPRKL